jgi:hypothetical protein
MIINGEKTHLRVLDLALQPPLRVQGELFADADIVALGRLTMPLGVDVQLGALEVVDGGPAARGLLQGNFGTENVEKSINCF